jgi:putative Mg2+ transporter-C (MgtC) family protein
MEILAKNLDLGVFSLIPWQTQLNFALRIIAAAMCGCLIGYERSRRSKGAGVRTHMIIGLASSLMMIVSKYGFFDMVGSGLNADASRIAAQIVTGIPFLGAGIIYIRRNQSSVQGLTTAAGILATCGIGMALGAGLYFIAIFATVLLIALQFLLHRILTGYDSSYAGEVIIVADHTYDAEAKVRETFASFSVTIQKCRVKRLDSGHLEFRINFKTTQDISAPTMAKILGENPEFTYIEV